MADKKDDKVVFLHNDEANKLERDPEIAKLVNSMRKMRDTVPVNYQLKAALKQKLMQEANTHTSESSLSKGLSMGIEEAGKKERQVQAIQWMLFLIPFMLVIASMFYYMAEEKIEPSSDYPYRVEREIFIDRSGNKNLSATTGGNNNYYFVYRGSLWEGDLNSQSTKEFLKPHTGEVYRQVAVDKKGERFILISEEEGRFAIKLIIKNGLEETIIYNGEAGQVIEEATWSPDGSRIAFTMEEAGKESVYKLELDATDEAPELLAEGSYPAWSPDGQQLAVERLGDNKESEIWLISINGSEKLWGLGGQPHWSSDNQLAFVLERRWEKILSYNSAGDPLLVSEQAVQEVWISDIEGKVKQKLTNLPGPTAEEEAYLVREWEQTGNGEKTAWTLRATLADNHPRWTQDGSHLLIERNYGFQTGLLLVNIGGKYSGLY
ncbi:MAG: hypothetical protein SCK28_13085 [Bacillota bacterium]|nr:hypothetical protein [Bacillota bacterium]